MRIIFRLIIIIFVTVMLFAGCNVKNINDDSLVIDSYDEFIESLESKGYQIKEVDLDEVAFPIKLFSEYPKYIDIDNNRVAVYEFPNQEIAKSQVETISRDGFSISSNERVVSISWISKPYFYQKGRLIVQHNTLSNKNLLNDFEKLLGEPITN